MIKLSGRPVADAMMNNIRERVVSLRERNVTPTILIVRVGDKPDDISYQRSAQKCCLSAGIAVKTAEFAADVPESDFLTAFGAAANDGAVHGILLLHPLPKHIDIEKVKNLFPRQKDVDCMLNRSLGRIFTNDGSVSPPCTAQAVMELLHYYGVKISGSNAVVIGRSMVVGKPLAMLLLNENATVTVCHSKTQDLQSITKNADIVVSTVGRAKMLNRGYFSAEQTVIDVGINVDENGNLCGDVDYEDVKDSVAALTPVPGGIGIITTRVLAQNLIDCCERQMQKGANEK